LVQTKFGSDTTERQDIDTTEPATNCTARLPYTEWDMREYGWHPVECRSTTHSVLRLCSALDVSLVSLHPKCNEKSCHQYLFLYGYPCSRRSIMCPLQDLAFAL